MLTTTLLLAGCASAPPERALSENPPRFATLPNGFEPLNPDQPSAIYAEAMAIPGDNITRYLERKHGHAKGWPVRMVRSRHDDVENELEVMPTGFRADPENLAQLRGGDDDGGGVDEALHHGMRQEIQ